MGALHHHEYMLLALQLSEQGRCSVSPNPMVGCVIVNDNQIVGQGFHQRAGEAHAEVYALQQAGLLAQGATAYVTLEPCCHHGRTPPCTQALINAGIKKVVVACLDPNPLMSGKGIAQLNEAGIETEVGLYQEQAKQLNEIFFHFITQHTPFVITKWAMSLDGKTITHPNDTHDISSSDSVKHSHQTRECVDAILIGSHTAIHDNPLLTVRMTDTVNPKQPIRIILSSTGNLPLHLNLFNQSLPGKTLVAVSAQADQTAINRLLEKNIEVLTIENSSTGHIHLPNLLKELGKRNITSILVEGGMKVHESFFQHNLVNKINVYIAPLIIGSLEKKQQLDNISITTLQRDMLITANYLGKSHV